ncbi:Polygalacturonase 1 [Thecaphora frezii]|nr:putative glycoside hydrolase family 28 protein [Thecaphora frezii]
MVQLASTVAVLALGATVAQAASSCTFTSAAAVLAGKKNCKSITLSNIQVPAKTTLDLTGLSSGTQVVFSGTTTFGYAPWEGPLISVSGNNVKITAASGAEIDCGGARWWDGKGSNGGKVKPKFFAAHKLTNSVIQGLTVRNTPVQAFSINGAENLTLDHITIDNSAGDVTNGGHNTDAFDIGSSNGVYITNANVKNQDDCLAINSGTDILFSGGTCSGGHGLSIGSVGGRSNNVVTDVRIENSSVINSDNGVRIKTVYGATGTVSNITFTDIQLSGIAKYGIDVQQDYQNGSPTGKPTTGVPITGLTIQGVRGSVKSSAFPAYILCGSGSCKNWKWTGNSISGGKASSCSNQPNGVSC